jgi:hypothetical protein
MAFCANSFTFLYMDNVRTSQETHILISMACYWHIFYILGMTRAHGRSAMSPGVTIGNGDLAF